MENNSNTEIRKVLIIDTKNAVRSIENVNDATKQTYSSMREYKSHIDRLTASLVDLDEESEDYKRVLRDIRESQERYNRIIQDTKKNTDNSIGSYNYLVQKMGELKKAWRATSDEMERNKIGTEINSINNELKDLDASIGNYQRNVGNYGSAFSQGFKQITDAIGVSIPSVRVFGDVIEKAFKGYEGVSTVITALKGAFSGAAKSGGEASELFSKQNKVVKDNTSNLEKLTNETKNWQKAEVAVEGASAAANFQLGKQAENAAKAAKEIKLFVGNQEAFDRFMKLIRDNGEVTFDAISNRLGWTREQTIDYIALLEQDTNLVFRTTVNGVTLLNDNFKNSSEIIKDLGSALDENKSKIGLFTQSLKGLGNGLVDFFSSSKTVIISILLALASLIKLISGLIAEYNRKIAEANQKEIEWLQSLKETSTALLTIGSSAAEVRIQFSLLGDEFRSLGDDEKKKREFFEKYKDTINSTLFPVKSLKDLEEAFVKNTDKYERALIARAEHQAAYNLLVKEYEQYLSDTLRFEGIDMEKLTPIDQETLKKANERWNMFSERILDTYNRTATIINNSGIFNQKRDSSTTTVKSTATTSEVGPINDMIARYRYLQETVEKGKEQYLLYQLDIENLLWAQQEERLKNEKYTDETIEAARLAHLKKITDIEEQIQALYETSETKPTEVTIDDKLKALEEEAAARIFIIDKTTQYEFDANKKILDINRERLLAQKELLEAELNNNNVSAENKKNYNDRLTQLNAELIDNEHQRTIAIANEVANEANMFGNAISNIFNSVASMYEEGTEEYKGLATAGATISMLQGVVAAISGAFQLGPILGPIYGAINAASVIAAGIANIHKIQETTLSSQPTVNNVSPSAASFKPAYATNVNSNSDITNIGDSISSALEKQEFFVSVTDINNVQNKVKVREENSTF